jgi:predicted alpha/beta-fold hydrolase
VIKAIATIGDRKLLMVGLSFGNLEKFYAEPGDTFIRIDGKEMGLPFDVLIFSGKTEADMQAMMAKSIGPDTIVHIDPKLKA